MEGWIRLHRKILEWEWYSDNNVKVLFLHCLLRANIINTSWRGIEIRKGQFFTSYASLSTELGLSVKEIRNASKKLEKTGELTFIGASNGTMITVCNYDSYQQNENTMGKRGASEGQARGKRGATDKEEEEEEIEEKEEGLVCDKPPKKTKKFIKPTVAELRAYCLEEEISVDVSRFFYYYESNGWKVGRNQMKDWKAALRTWGRNQVQNTKTNTNGQQPIATGSGKDWKAGTERYIKP